MTRARPLRSRRGQSLVEFTLILPVILTMVLGMLELGFAINHSTTIETATRQGARVGSQLVNGSRTCGGGVTASSNLVDPQIIGAVEFKKAIMDAQEALIRERAAMMMGGSAAATAASGSSPARR